MIPQVIKRRIGKVNIIDMNGSMTGLWTARLKIQLEQAFQNLDGNPAVLNFRHITDIDTLGVRFLFQVTSDQNHLSILAGDKGIMDFFNRYPESKRFRLLNNEQDLVQVYGSDLTEENVKDDELRGNLRLQTAISIRFSYHQDSGQKQCVGVVSNLSEHGFYIEYIDILSVEQSLTELNPYNIQSLDFVLSLSNGTTVSGQGKVLHWQLNHEQFGIGVHIEKFDSQDEKRFSDFLQSQREVIVHHQKGR